MDFSEFEQERQFREAWDAVNIERNVAYSLFTFGESELPYYLVLNAGEGGERVSLRQGEVRVARPMILTPYNTDPEFQNFFEDEDGEQYIDFLLARTAAFSNLKLTNAARRETVVSDSAEETIDRLNRTLDDDEEDRTAILSAPHELAGLAILRYTTERILSSAPDNVQELRERGFLP